MRKEHRNFHFIYLALALRTSPLNNRFSIKLLANFQLVLHERKSLQGIKPENISRFDELPSVSLGISP